MNKWYFIASAALLLASTPGWITAQESQPTDTKIIIIEEKIDAQGNKTVKKSVHEGNFNDAEIEKIISSESQINKAPSGKKGYLGVMIENAEAGVRVTEVVEGSPAANAGILAGDQITSVNGNSVTSIESLVNAVSAEQPGAVVQINFIRAGSPNTVSATLDERIGNALVEDVFEWDEHVRDRELQDRERATHEREMELHERKMKDHAREMEEHKKSMERHHAEIEKHVKAEKEAHDSKPRFGVYLDEVEAGPGVIVTRVSEGSVAAGAGVQKGDVITSFNGISVNSSDDLIQAVKSAPADKKVKVELIRQGKKIKEKVVFSKA
jgi:C-terminal processing protease CtpA/Prc